MKSMRKVIAITIFAAMLLSLGAGCTFGDEDDGRVELVGGL